MFRFNLNTTDVKEVLLVHVYGIERQQHYGHSVQAAVITLSGVKLMTP
jgi:hypothetical protein